MVGQQQVYDYLAAHDIPFEYIEHPEAPTIEIARQYWSQPGATHCKNIFLRNHKGNQHFLVVLQADHSLDIHSLERILGQGKLSFASEERMMKYLGLRPGSVSPFGLVNDATHHVILYMDIKLREAEKLCFHPNDNHATLTLKQADFQRYLGSLPNRIIWQRLYE